jgi:hypothetical protein
MVKMDTKYRIFEQKVFLFFTPKEKGIFRDFLSGEGQS